MLRFVALGVLCTALGSCDFAEPQVCSPDRPEDPDEWPLASAEEAGFSPSQFESALALRPLLGIDGMVIVRHGKLVTERYWRKQRSSELHDLRSATKSITSLLVGIAIDRQAISDVSEPVMLRLRAAYPDVQHPEPWKDSFTIENLLRMETGLACDDDNPSSPGNEENMYPKRDWVRFFLDLPVVDGTPVISRYCTAGVVTLGRVVKEATQQTTEQFADEALLGPLGIRKYCWSTFDEGQQVDTGGHLFLRPRDMAKIGQLVLQRGQWQGQQIVSEDWIDRSTRLQTQLGGGQPYGYLWWLRRAPMTGDTGVPFVAAQGNGGQYIFVVPSYDLVVVFTGSNYDSPAGRQPFNLLEAAILPAFTLE